MKGDALIISIVIFLDMLILAFMGWVVFLLVQPIMLAILAKLAMNAMEDAGTQPLS